MAAKIGLGHAPDVKVGQGQTIRTAQNIQVRNDLDTAKLAAEDEDEKDVEPEPPEPPELEDAGDSEAGSGDAPPGSAFDRGWRGPLPLVWDLPARLHPQVRYRIDDDLAVHRLSRKRLENEDLEQAVAEAIALYLRESGVVLKEPGDWCRIACIPNGDQGLVELIEKGPYKPQLDRDRFKSIGSVLKSFAIELPNRDVVTPQTLLDPARKGSRGKKTTRAAALRWASRRPETMPDGESWTAADWDGFEVTQRKKKPSARERGPKETDR